ncbi:MAG: GGDEF domain-containing protein, partial [Candidatus Aminicenantes bacterium]|nr:GGDEF domain-containing protein [Candidatus Aminicenantes bacterium]
MNKAFFLQLVFNAALLLTLTLIYNLVAVQWRIGRASLRQVPVGVVIGIMGVVVMLASWQLQPGIVFDTRSILLAVSGLFFGTIPTVVAMLITAAFRASIGGPAVGMGIAVIFTSGAIGIAWRRMRRPFLADITWRELFLFGLVIHLCMLGCALILPGATRWQVLANIVLPVLLVYPVVTAILGKLLADHLKREITNQKLRESEERYQTLANISPVGIFRT